MRLTLPSPVLPGRHLDVEVEAGLPAGDLRRRLAVLTGDTRWAAPRARLEVAGHVLDDDHPAGAPPLLPGAHLAPGPAPHHDVDAAVRAGSHLAVLTGPGAGRLLPLPDGGRLTLRPYGPVRVQVRRRGARTTVRTIGARGSMTVEPRPRLARARTRSRRPTVGRLPRRWPTHADVRVGRTHLRLRVPAEDEPAPRGRGPRVPPWAWTALASSAAALALAAALRQPLLLLTAVTGLVGLLGARGARAPQRRTVPQDATVAASSDVPLLRLTTGLRLRDLAGPVPGDDALWPPDATLALVGSRGSALGAARAVVLRTLGAGAPVRLVLRTGAAADWEWTRWWEPDAHLPAAGDDHDDILVVADGSDTALASWRLAAPHARLLLVVPPGSSAPAWASTVLRTDDGTSPGPAPERVDADVADAQARSAAALRWLLSTHGTSGARAPALAPALGDLPRVPAPDAAAVASSWRRPGAPRVLATAVGTGVAGRPVVLDLVRDGPHALVAGTTGAGKSELLTTVVLGLALTHPPSRLAVLLVDFKGGTGLGPLARLPHVVDHVHDLDVAAARRTLVGLRAELRRRERLLAAAGCADVADLDRAGTASPARLLVVVDELRALVDDVPEAAAALARLAAQGRALGMHLLLATQRPAGAVPADLRANVGLRIALRVADEDDSRDVIGCADAAHLDVAHPGSALVRTGARPVAPLQVARARHRRAAPPVRVVPSVPARQAPAWRIARRPDDDVSAWVAACRQAARDLPGTGVPWSRALPDRVTADEVGAGADADGLLVAVADVPDEQRWAPVRWGPGHGHLLVLGGPRSGRSTSLVTVGHHALLDGAHVHTVGLPDGPVRRLREAAGPLLGTTLPLDDVHRALLLLDRLATRRDGAGAVVVLVDGLDALLDTLATHARGLGVDLLTTLLRHPPTGVRVAAAGPVVPALSRLAGTFGLRLVLPVPDASLDAQAGVPHGLVGARSTPGRAVASSTQGALVCQVVLPGPSAAGAPAAAAGHRAGAALRLGVLPEMAAPPPASAPPGGGIPLGIGGDGPAPVVVDPDRPLVVTGAPGTGRTTVLRTLAHGWAASGHDVLVVTADARPGRVRGRWPGALAVPPSDALAHLDRAVGRAPGPARRTVVLLDDVDVLERDAPEVAERVGRLLDPGSPDVRVVALCTTSEHAAAGWRGPVATALRARQLLVLDPHGPAAADLLGAGSALHTDPRVRPAGRGVLRRDRGLVRVQVHRPPAPHPAQGAA
ncbi:FtsK/SpoIIIE domain-containing protein [Cellulomonas dongxiuzhuiae]|uniref:FtsK domain-containing protein n=1 Tax=Cellulomonas dongxiuzhuiae TaxID=2819979 RepID=A0ABX8GGP3_9CELL|nr:FtsK/SpoIIIE domain-containing protein [Cellulomonas dongxiuzhuiae]MBO3093968.1 hypothetical protein [Cellulomonas dongxiuzhuiae]QWC15047.1 hypothetical protein KKR89_11970 [Cellulomonas dongxiuzhuiae]